MDFFTPEPLTPTWNELARFSHGCHAATVAQAIGSLTVEHPHALVTTDRGEDGMVVLVYEEVPTLCFYDGCDALATFKIRPNRYEDLKACVDHVGHGVLCSDGAQPSGSGNQQVDVSYTVSKGP